MVDNTSEGSIEENLVMNESKKRPLSESLDSIFNLPPQKNILLFYQK